ncbi:MAG: hypothetical protein ABIO38_03115 [Luteimonas sp.]
MRGHNQWLGWLPLWVLGMPLVAWWALHRFRLPGWSGKPGRPSNELSTRRRRGVQARRRSQPVGVRGFRQAA